jgi:hypothetical protein
MEHGFGKAAAAAAGVAATLNIVTSLLEKTGHERGAEGFEALTTGATGLASALLILPTILSAFGKSLSPKVAIILAIATAIISLGVAISKWHENSEERLERLNKEAKEAAESAEEARKNYDALLSNKSKYGTLQKELEELTRGTDEWKQKLIEVNG